MLRPDLLDALPEYRGRLDPSIAKPGTRAASQEAAMDILITFVIILIICLAIAPFFLLSGAFGAKNGRPRTTARVS